MFEQTDIFASLQYSTNNNTWQKWDGRVINLAAGQKVYIKALNPNPSGMTRDDCIQYHKFIFEGKIAASGNIQYLLEDSGSRVDVPAYAYYYMFEGCTSLTSAPALSATTLAEGCYVNMFEGCTSLTSAPALPATTLANYCYNSMFLKCTSLASAPALPATTLADGCYGYMFSKCTKFSDCHMKASMEGVYKKSTHGDTMKTVIYDL